MNIAIEVVSTEVRRVIGKNGANAGKTFEIPEVTAYVKLPEDKYPAKVTLSIPRDAPHPAPGMYQLDVARSVYIDNNGRLALRQAPVLVPVASGKAQAS